MNQHPPVPRLDLAPKLKRPLSLWNPLDYLRLLYWVFYFPQALRWYMDTFGGGYIPEGEMNWRKGWELQRQNSQFQLHLQGLVLAVPTLLALAVLNQKQVVFSLNSLVALNPWLTTLLLVPILSIGLPMALARALVEIPKAVSSWVSEVVRDVAWGVAGGVDLQVRWMMALVVGAYLVTGVVAGLEGDGLGQVILVLILAILRPESWLLGQLLVIFKPWNGRLDFFRITPIPIRSLSNQLEKWLQHDWETGLHNANQLLTYTLQFIGVTQAVNKVLGKTSLEQIIWRVSRLTEAPCNLQLLRCASASVVTSTDTRLDTPARAAVAGFWYLHKKEPMKAEEAFAVVRSLLYGEEMFTLAQTLAAFNQANEPNAIATVEIPSFPQEPLLRPITWQTLTSLRSVVENAKIIQDSRSSYQRSSALNRALGELTEILDNPDTLPQAERGLIVDIARTWRKALEGIAKEVGKIAITKRVSNPYIIGDPVVGDRFVGREDVIRQLQELWMRSSQLQSVVIYGHRRMGKTSILRNVASFVKAGVQVAYVNLLEVADAPEGVVEVLMAISDAISEVMQIPPPSNEDLLSLPQPTFRRYLTQVEQELGTKGLIIALDEFEKIEELMSAGKIPKNFMGYLRGLTQKSSKIAFVLAGLHTLEEMTADYFQPFFASVITIKVGFMEAGATHQILANPSIEDFPLDYTPEALDKIYELTHGQPYLVQLVAFQLVRRYNDEVFNTGRARDNNLTIGDVEAVVNDSEFFQRGRYYFDGVWGQAARGAAGQREILQALASHAEGLSITALSDCTNIEIAALQEALNTLKRHDVVEEIKGRSRIIVELFRRWVSQL